MLLIELLEGTFDETKVNATRIGTFCIGNNNRRRTEVSTKHTTTQMKQ